MNHLAIGGTHRLEHDLSAFLDELIDQLLGVDGKSRSTTFRVYSGSSAKTGGLLAMPLQNSPCQFMNRATHRSPNTDKRLGLFATDVGNDDIVLHCRGDLTLETISSD